MMGFKDLGRVWDAAEMIKDVPELFEGIIRFLELLVGYLEGSQTPKCITRIIEHITALLEIGSVVLKEF